MFIFLVLSKNLLQIINYSIIIIAVQLCFQAVIPWYFINSIFHGTLQNVIAIMAVSIKMW